MQLICKKHVKPIIFLALTAVSSAISGGTRTLPLVKDYIYNLGELAVRWQCASAIMHLYSLKIKNRWRVLPWGKYRELLHEEIALP